MKLHILSDLHLSFGGLGRPQTEADVVVLAGDIARPPESVAWALGFDKPVLYVPGNHEFYGGSIEGTTDELRRLCAAGRVHLLDNDEIVLGGVRFLGSTLWTDFMLFGDGDARAAAMDEAQRSLRDFSRIRIGSAVGTPFTPADSAGLFRRNADWLESRLRAPHAGPTVVITHHAPSARSIHPRFAGSPTTGPRTMITTALTDMFELAYPIGLGPMGGVAGGHLAAAVSNAGGLGLVGGGYGDASWLHTELSRVKEETRKPWGVGLITWSVDAGIVELVLGYRPHAVMHSFGDPGPHAALVKAAGSRLICQVQDVAGARLAVKAGADLIVAQGTEAGGHGGGRSTLPLVPAVVDAVAPTPVVAAGGIADGRGLAAALMLGAHGALIGTRFYASNEALGHDLAKQFIAAAHGDGTARTTVFDTVRELGWPASYTGRALRNRFIERWHGRERELVSALDVERGAYHAAARRQPRHGRGLGRRSGRPDLERGARRHARSAHRHRGRRALEDGHGPRADSPRITTATRSRRAASDAWRTQVTLAGLSNSSTEKTAPYPPSLRSERRACIFGAGPFCSSVQSQAGTRRPTSAPSRAPPCAPPSASADRTGTPPRRSR